MLILGIDPGTARMGYGLIDFDEKIPADGKKSPIKFVTAGCLETAMETAMPERLLFLSEELDKIVGKHKPDVACVEQLFFGINAKTGIAVGQARGIILMVLAKNKVKTIVDYQGLQVKFAVTGSGKSDKKQVQESVRQLLGMKEIIKPDDAADGLALAICHFIKSTQPAKPAKIKKEKAETVKGKKTKKA